MRLTKQTVELLNSEEIKLAITPNNLPLLSALTVFDTIGSTNSYLLDCAKTGAPSGSVCIADQQTRGRGRQGRTWYSPPGANVYCSLLWYFPAYQTDDLAALSLAVAVMVARCLEKFTISSGVQLKWPNDILFEGKKLAGILLEALPSSADQVGVVIGVGLNLQLPDKNLEAEQWIDIASITSQSIARNRLAGLLINDILQGLQLYQQQGFSAFIADWRKLHVMQGKRVTVQLPLETVIGILHDINNKGELQLLTSEGELRCFRYGEVSLR